MPRGEGRAQEWKAAKSAGRSGGAGPGGGGSGAGERRRGRTRETREARDASKPIEYFPRMVRVSVFLFVLSASLASLSTVAGCNGSSGGGPGTPDYCAAISTYANKCNITDPCSTATVKDCASTAANASAGALAATTACVEAATCGDGGAASLTQCLSSKISALTPTATQTTLAQDYCAACPGTETAATCASRFYGPNGVATASAILAVSDAIATSIDAKCVPGVSADAGNGVPCASAFTICVGATLLAAEPPPAACEGAGDGG